MARVQQPNKAEFEADVEKLRAELKVKEAALEAIRNKIKSFSSNSSSTEEQKALRNELSEIKKKQQAIKATNGKVFDTIKSIDESIKRKVKEINTQKAKVPFKSVEDIEKQIARYEQQVESGSLRLVEEKKVLADVQALKRAKKSFATFDSLQAEIDAEKAQVADLKKTVNNTESNTLSDRYNEITANLDSMREESQKLYSNRNSLFDQRNKLQNEREAAFAALKERQDTFYKGLTAWRESVKEERAARAEREKAEREAYEAEKKRAAAAEKLEIASAPAFGSELASAETLLAHFDPTYKPTSVASPIKPSAFAAEATRQVEQLPENVQVIKKDLGDFFSGNGGKKNKKRAPKPTSGKEKFSLDVSILEGLSNLNIGVPMSKEEVSKTIEDLRAKVAYFKDNQARVTQENIEKAKAELAKYEAEEAKESEVPAAEESTADAEESTDA
ncbi:hypothetical protein NADFUDRAFT_84073 [Nadsonia fulvescens var. elongata DSM 6958]|uniref:Nuclear segregation protein BFR1 n=1 Tax=Nadsonia fulvescens var. elongata DSM 6958 TaxID=857566 RepID=A0A1E3PGK1_9ASCO|nr:hypothetical protein NADFUDRAFT_84073 [Nadsonia fulvescens var. elongata DSM 6958]